MASEPIAAQIPSAGLALLMLLGKLERIARGDVPVEIEPHDARIILRLIGDERGR